MSAAQKHEMSSPISPDTDSPDAAMGYAPRKPCGWLGLAGRDRLDFLQRLSTNDFRGLTPPHGLPAVLASPVGRFIALLFAYAGPEAVNLRVEAGQADALVRYFESMIFWQDDAQVTDLTAETGAIELYGGEWPAHLQALGFAEAASLPAYASLSGQIAGESVTLCKGGALDLADWILVTHGGSGEVEAAVAGLARRVSEDELKLMRIEAGLPAWGHELSDAVTPLEVNLLPAVSFDKGCYVGQEVIARQTNYDKITRRMVGLVFGPDAPADVEGARVRASGRDGSVTSSAFAPRHGSTIALAIVPRSLAEPDAAVTVLHHEQPYEARVVTLPFE